MQCARKLLNVAAAKRPTAIFASNDEMAAGALSVAHSMGLGVPEDVSVVGFGRLAAGQPGMARSHYDRQPISDMAAEAADLLLCTLRGGRQRSRGICCLRR